MTRFFIVLSGIMVAIVIAEGFALAAVIALKPIEVIPADAVSIQQEICEKRQAAAYGAGYVAGQNKTMLAVGRPDLLTTPMIGADRYAGIAERYGFRREGGAP